MLDLISEFADLGIAGATAAGALWWAWQKEKQVRQLYERMLAASTKQLERYNAAIVELNQTIRELVRTVESLGDTLDKE